MKLGPYQCAYEPVQAKGGSSHSDEGKSAYFNLTIATSCMSFLVKENLLIAKNASQF